jgi:hypothetical protein
MLCRAGGRPRLLLRDPDRLDVELRHLVEPAVGDQRDADYVMESTRGVDAVYWVYPEDSRCPTPTPTPRIRPRPCGGDASERQR